MQTTVPSKHSGKINLNMRRVFSKRFLCRFAYLLGVYAHRQNKLKKSSFYTYNIRNNIWS
jgi:hypothetical protein